MSRMLQVRLLLSSSVPQSNNVSCFVSMIKCYGLDAHFATLAICIDWSEMQDIHTRTVSDVSWTPVSSEFVSEV